MSTAEKYFSLFDFPLTNVEAWYWQWQSSEPLSVDVQSRPAAWRERQTRFILAERKYRLAGKVSRWLRFIPFIRLIAICNTLAINHSREAADIDFFIVTARRRVWLVRFLAVGFVKLFSHRPRPGGGQERDAICLSFFVDDHHLNMSDVALKPYDVYLSYWLAQVYPLYDEQETYQKFWQENRWLNAYLPRVAPVIPHPDRQLTASRWPFKRWAEKLLMGRPGEWLEQKLKAWQLTIMPRRLTSRMNRDTSVVVNDFMLKFHDQDRRAEYRQRFENQ